MSKRRRNSSEDEESMDSNSTEPSPSVTPVGRKRKKLDPTELCQQLYDSIRNFKKEDGSMLCDTFIRAPKRRQEPSYYEVVANPIDLLRVQQKLKTDSYEDIEELTADFELLVNNAKAFYKPESTEYQDACSLWEVFKTNKAKLLESVNDDSASLPGSGNSIENRPRTGRIGRPRKSTTIDEDQMSENSSENNDFDPYEELFAAVMTATEDNRPLHTEFQLLPSKKLYPEYYDIIEHPIDLKFIANKIQTNAYTNLSEMEKDLLQMCKNACTFNETGSQIYKDAKTLKKLFQQRKLELESGKYRRSGRRRAGQSLSAVCAALKEDPESSDEDLDDEMDGDQTGPLWQLFDYLYNQASAGDGNPLGTPLGESLWKLPNRRFNPEYYSLIKKPISMAQIQKKLKKNEYNNITEMTADLYLMIDNAKKSYSATHKTHKDAVKMQKILNQKLVDNGIDMESSDTEDTDSSNMAQSSIMTTPTPTPSLPEKKKKGRPRIHPLPTSPAPTLTPIISTPSANKNYRVPNNPVMKKKLLALQKYLVDYSVDGRQPMALFMEKPSKKLYPDYYQVIQHPIDMNTIEANIKNDRYGTLDDIVGDYRLMFSNCRKYNEENSMIYDDANLMERVLNDKLKELSGIIDRRPKLLKSNRKVVTALDTKLKQLYEAIRDYKEPKNARQLSLIFMKLPSKNEYPDYYEIIKQPIDMEKIALKLKQQQYDTIDELAADFMLMFENASKYNEPDSQIYKDALVLQQICVQTKQILRTEDETIPDVPQVIQEILLQLFTTVYNYQDEEGRCYSDSLAELPEIEEIDGKKVRAISLDLIKRRLDKGLYKRLDTFQEDVFSCFDRARRLSRTDSQVFEDSIELQSFFIKKRDELCKNGEVLNSPALSYSAMHLSAAVEAIRQDKLLQEGDQEKEEIDPLPATQGESMTIDQKVYSPGDFVYYELQDDPTPGILYIERLWTNNENIKMCFGNVFLRPYQTYHLQTRKFLEQEVFKSDSHQTVPLTDLLQKCFVMNVKDYFKLKPEGYADKDVYVCESRYTTKVRTFKKIKTWPYQRSDTTKLILREIPLEPKRVQSVFKDRPEPSVIKAEIPLDEVELQVPEKERPNLMVVVQGGEEGNTYFEQYNTICSGVVKTGDYVYVATETGKQAIAQINSLWETKDGKSFFRGPWLMLPSELPPSTAPRYYKQEVFLSTVQETTPTVAIVGRCCVLEYHEYTSMRPTEIPENDVYLCESIYDELNKQLRKLLQPGGLKKFTHSQAVLVDEIYHFKRPIVLQKIANSELSMGDSKHTASSHDLELKLEANGGGNSMDMLGMTEDSMDTIGSGDFTNTSSPIPSSSGFHLTTPMGAKRPPAFTGGKSGKKVVTGYILYSSERRKSKVQENPDCKFGEISRMIGNEWRAMPQSERQSWEDRASKINEDNAAKYAEEVALNGGVVHCPSPQLPIMTPAQLSAQHEFVHNQVFECCWDKCDWQFEDPGDLLEHCVADGVGCVHKYFANLQVQGEPTYHCLWRNCIRLKRNQPPLPNIQRLIKHVRDVHAIKGIGKIVNPNDRSKNYLASTRRHLNTNVNPMNSNINYNQPQQQQMQPVMTTPIATGSPQIVYTGVHQQPQTVTYVSAVPAEPLFITVPPRPQRILHSDAYIKYVEGLQNNSSYISNWDRTLKATRETINVDYNRLPVSWLNKKGKEKPEEVVDALWKLRNFMWRDALSLSKINEKNFEVTVPSLFAESFIYNMIKHVRDVHAIKGIGKIVNPNDRSKNYLASTRRHLNTNVNPMNSNINYNQPQQQQMQPVMTTPIATGSPQIVYTGVHQQPQTVTYVSAVPAEPLFITVPLRPQRILHSDAYIKYVEGLQNNSSYISNWDRTLKATRDTINVDYNRLPVSWLNKKGKEKPEEVVDALWKLRNFMWRDALSLSKSMY